MRAGGFARSLAADAPVFMSALLSSIVSALGLRAWTRPPPAVFFFLTLAAACCVADTIGSRHGAPPD